MSTIKIKIQLFSILRDSLPPEAKGKCDLMISRGSDLNVLLNKLEIKRTVIISVNGNHISDRSYLLQHADEIKIFSSLNGG